MHTNEILDEIYRVREDIARECNYDIDVFFARMREDLERLKAEGWHVVYPARGEAEPVAGFREGPPEPTQATSEKRHD